MDRALVAGLIHASLFVVVGGLMAISVGLKKGADLIPFCYAFLIALLAFGTYRRNRLAAAILVLLPLLIEGGIWWKDRNVPALITALVFIPFYAFGLWGTVVWHTFKFNEEPAAPTPTAT